VRVIPQVMACVCQNVAMWEIVYVHWKACHMYLQMVPSDVSTVDEQLYMKIAVTSG